MQCAKLFSCCLLVIGLAMVQTAAADTITVTSTTWNAVIGAPGATVIRYDNYVSNPQPGQSPVNAGTVATYSNTFMGFVSPSAANTTVTPLPPPVGVTVSHSSGTVTFWDSTTYFTLDQGGGVAVISDIKMVPGTNSTTFTFVDPSNPAVDVALSQLAMKFSYVCNQSGYLSNAVVHLYDLSNTEIGTTALPGTYGGDAGQSYGWLAKLNGVEANLIHKVVVTSTSAQWQYSIGSGPGTQLDDMAFASVVPEPGSLSLLAAGLIGLLCYAWRKRK